MKKLIYAIFSILITVMASAQCGTDEYNHNLVKDKLSEGQNYAEYLESIYDIKYDESVDLKTKKATRTIPVVFHVIHAYGDENISKAQIEDQLRVVNEDFQRQNADASNTRDFFKSRAANFNIEFKLARIAPDGSYTEGITRTYDPVNMIENYEDGSSEAKSTVSAWDRSRYLNIWVVKRIESSRAGTILGYAQLPGGPASTDGIVMIHDRVGTIGTANSSGKGRTLTHEIGHWLGLYHPFQGGCSGSDGVDDTPPVAEASYGCTASQNPNTCNTDFPNEIDMVENYMDYANGSCMNAFTNGQLARVNGFLASNQYRARNIAASNLVATGVNTNPVSIPKADFWYDDPDKKVICAGQSMKFKDFSYNGDITQRTWKFEGGTPASSSAVNPEIVYNTPGVYKVELDVANSAGGTTASQILFVTVLPNVAESKAPFGQDFESNTSVNSWQFEKDLEGNGWERNTLIGYSGNNSIMAYVDENTPQSLRMKAISEAVDVSEYEVPLNLHFKYAYARRVSSASEILLVLGSVDCGQSWATLKAYNSTNLVTGPVSPNWEPQSKSDWGRASISLSKYKDETNLFLRFDVISQQGNSVFIDDINIGEFALSTPELYQEQTWKVIPNPAQNSFIIKTENNTPKGKILVRDLTGRLLLEEQINSEQMTVNSSGLPNGLYILSVMNENKVWSSKLIISK
ncbi:MAG: T9SS C-terminal target domain-containing protein [Bacteroidetes bacterium]|nr:T9SS C-terminal target domain-containing protein [Bacteroidota bacterium]